MRQPDTFLYFAYGSNMLTRRLQERTPSARVVGVATLARHELRWHKVSKDGSAKCDIVPGPAPESCVHGVVFEIASADKAALDLAEGVGMGYREQLVEVRCSQRAIEAWTYRATNIDRLALPYTWYKALVVAGAKEHALPAAYIAALDAAPARDDPKRERDALNRLLAASGAVPESACTATQRSDALRG